MTTRRLHFIGNVLPTTAASEQHPEAGVNSFHITESESNQMDLTGLPLHLEHDDKLPVGTIQKQFTDKSGKKWIIGEINDDSIAAKFAGKDLESNAAMFKGLSLQHVHSEYSDGTSSKRPVEVSLACRKEIKEWLNVRPGDRWAYQDLTDSISLGKFKSFLRFM